MHNQLISARIGATIVLSCGVEASPRSVNYWTLSRGVGDIGKLTPIFDIESVKIITIKT